METQATAHEQPRQKPRYKWPWFLLAFFLLGIVLAILWMSREVEKTRRIRDLNAPSGQGLR